ncbi:unnamed protein product [Phaeothamnion confervicola]
MSDASSTTASLAAASIASLESSVNTFYLMIGTVLVFFMHAGFAMLEVGCVQHKNTMNILVSNVYDATMGSIFWWLLGYGIAFGNDNYGSDEPGGSGFVGTTGYALSGSVFRGDPADEAEQSQIGYNWSFWLFQWAFSVTTSTIISGAVAERITFGAYLLYAFMVMGIMYPFVAHWGWNTGGWASAFREADLLAGCGIIDFAGSGVVHLTGGVVAFVGIIMLGARTGRFVNGEVRVLPQVSWVYQTLGTLILWFGWYGFNGMSTLIITGGFASTAGRVVVNSTIAAGSGLFGASIIGVLLEKRIDPEWANNGLLTGLVAVTAPCATCEPEGAFLIGLAGGIIYYFAARLLIKLELDDVVNAVPVHFFGGMFGLLMPGFFTTEKYYGQAYFSARAEKCTGVFYGGPGNQLGAQIVFLIVILGWVGVLSVLTFLVARHTFGLRLDPEVEAAGMDSSKHGGVASAERLNNYGPTMVPRGPGGMPPLTGDHAPAGKEAPPTVDAEGKAAV